jgi:mannose-1-phosphate guanylyltransferase/mannose-6-phosphate isomerase
MGKESLLQQTAKRISGNRFAPAIVVSGEDQGVFIKRQLEAAGASLDAILLEPVGRNTAAAAALAAAWVFPKGDEILLLMPSDHAIGDREAFMRAIEVGAPHAERGAIVTFGATPTGPNTQYGYIEAGARGADGAFPIARFVEKPRADRAAEYVASGRFFWNAGIFMMKASTLLEEMRQFLPATIEAVELALGQARVDIPFVRPSADAFSMAENISIDHGIMEKTGRGMVVPVQMGWSDVGAWDAVWKLAAKDSAGNAIQGDVVALDTRDSLLRNDGGPLIATVGLEKTAVIAMSDAVLVAPLERMSDLKTLVEALRPEHADLLTAPRRAEQAWGSCETVARSPLFEIRHIVVNPGAALSTASEVASHWFVVRGSAQVTIGGEVSTVAKNGAIDLPAAADCRLANTGDAELELLEIRFGRW